MSDRRIYSSRAATAVRARPSRDELAPPPYGLLVLIAATTLAVGLIAQLGL